MNYSWWETKFTDYAALPKTHKQTHRAGALPPLPLRWRVEWSEPIRGWELHPLKSSGFRGALLRQPTLRNFSHR
jgi:hypothetical protein